MVMYFVRQAVALAVTPYWWVGAAVLRAWWLLRRARPARRWLLASLLLWWLPATPWAEFLLHRPLESAFPARIAADYPVVDAIVVLGGTTGQVGGPAVEAEERHGSRVQTGAKLFHAGRAPLVFVTGSPYRTADGARRSEALDMRDVLVGLGVPATAILMDDTAVNTRGNAEGAARLLPAGPKTRVLLVTSALHLPRSMALFRKLGFDPVPAACDFVAGGRPHALLGFLPGPAAAARVAAALKEYVGRLAARMLGEA